MLYSTFLGIIYELSWTVFHEAAFIYTKYYCSGEKNLNAPFLLVITPRSRPIAAKRRGVKFEAKQNTQFVSLFLVPSVKANALEPITCLVVKNSFADDRNGK